MNFIKKIFEGKTGPLVHLQFQKFSRGEFRNRAVFNARRTGNKYTISTSAEFANELVRDVAEKLGYKKVLIKGAIVSTSDLRSQLQPKEVKQFQGVKRYIIEKEMTGEEVIKLLDEFPKTFFALSFSTPDGETSLKIKPKSPKSGKPGSKGEEKPKADFCRLVTTDKALGQDFVFETPDWKKAEITHTFFIDEIKIPSSLKDDKDFAKIREGAIRKGRILREGEIDGKKIREEKQFEA